MIKVIKASAGSGKTYKLTYEYIKFLLGVKRKGRYELAEDGDVERHRHILAVTFTNKATGEMKERIIRELSILAGEVPDKNSEYLDDLCRDLGNVSPEDVKKAAYRAMMEILFDYTNFNVSTIDAFFQLVLRTFAKELRMSYNYEIEIDDEYAIKVGLNDFFSSLAHSKSSLPEEAQRARRAKMWIREFVRDEVQSGKTWNIFTATETNTTNRKRSGFSFGTFLECLKQEDMRQYLDELVRYIDKHDSSSNPPYYINKFKSALCEEIQRHKHIVDGAKEAIFKLAENEGFFVDDLSGNGGMLWLAKLDCSSNDNGIESLNIDKINKCIHNAETGSVKWFKIKKVGKTQYRLEADTISKICEQLKVMAETWSSYRLCVDIHRNIYMLGLLGEVKRYMDKYRSENEMILLGDTNDLLRKIINNDETPFVYERVGVWLSHFLIDEFQDTSRSQWENMRPLLFNSCAEGCDNLIIGDEKQCIYRFRNADSSLLRTEVANHFTVTQNDGGSSYNWRSMPEVVHFNNDFFTYLSSSLKVDEEYSNVKQELPPKKEYKNRGYVEINYIDEKAEKDVALADGGDGKYRTSVLKRLPDLITDIVSRGYKYKDIAVLVFSNYEGVEVVQHILDYNATRTEGQSAINVVSSESLLLRNSASVRLIISYLRYLDTKLLANKEEHTDANEDIPVDNEGYVHRLLRKYSHMVYSEGCEPGVALEKSFETEPKNEVSDNMSLSSLLPENTESFNLVSIIEHIIAQNIFGKKLECDNAFIQAFQDCVLEFSNRSNASIHEFLKWWDKVGCKKSIDTPEGQDAINVLTIHKSKGLEYKCVILPFCNWELTGKEETLWVSKEELMKSRLFVSIDESIIPPVVPVRPNSSKMIVNSPLSDCYNVKLRERIIDALNKTYVGFTRAVDEMYIFTPLIEEGKDMKLQSFLAQYRSGDDLVFTIGEKGYNSEKKKPTPKSETTKKDTLKLPATMPLYKVDNIKLQYKVEDEYTNERREQGIRLHKVMKRVKVKEDVDFALSYYRAKGLIGEKHYESDSRIVKDALACERVQWWFDPRNRVYNERSLLDDDGTITRPDRFFVTPDGRTVVVDYKFGKKTAKNVKEFCEQVQGYMNVLRKVGMENVEGYLWFPLEGDSDEAIVKVC